MDARRTRCLGDQGCLVTLSHKTCCEQVTLLRPTVETRIPRTDTNRSAFRTPATQMFVILTRKRRGPKTLHLAEPGLLRVLCVSASLCSVGLPVVAASSCWVHASNLSLGLRHCVAGKPHPAAGLSAKVPVPAFPRLSRLGGCSGIQPTALPSPSKRPRTKRSAAGAVQPSITVASGRTSSRSPGG